MSGRRSREDVRRRGRLSQPKSVQRYSKPHALFVHKARMPLWINVDGSKIIDISNHLRNAMAGTVDGALDKSNF